MEQVKYTNMVFDDLFEVISKSTKPWPVKYTRAQKVKLLDELEEHFKQRDEFEKCKRIMEIRELVMQKKGQV